MEALTSPAPRPGPAVGLGIPGRRPGGGCLLESGLGFSASPSGLWASLSVPACLVPRSLFLGPPLSGSSVHGHLCY